MSVITFRGMSIYGYFTVLLFSDLLKLGYMSIVIFSLLFISYVTITGFEDSKNRLDLRKEGENSHPANLSLQLNITTYPMQTTQTTTHQQNTTTVQQLRVQTTKTRSVQNIEDHKKGNKHVRYHPLRDITFKVSESNRDRDVFVVPRRVYYDNRPVALKSRVRRRVVIILAEVHDHARKTILACELNGSLSKSLEVLEDQTSWVRHHHPGYTHSTLVIQCAGLPQHAIFNGSIAKVIYKKKRDNYYSRVESEKPLFLHVRSHNPIPKKGIVMCTTMYSHPDTFDQWLKYAKYIGVDRVHVNAHRSFANMSVQFYPYFNESLNAGFVQMDVWLDIVGRRNFYHSQVLKYQDCLYRHIGVFKYGLFLDYDDFFNPMIANRTDIHYYLSKFFPSGTIGSVYIPWRQMKCAPRKKDAPNGNLTSILTGYESKVRVEKKCIHRLNAVQFVVVHHTLKLLEGYIYSYHTFGSAYVAHNRHTNKNCL
jgi:hypothetical protein